MTAFLILLHLAQFDTSTVFSNPNSELILAWYIVFQQCLHLGLNSFNKTYHLQFKFEHARLTSISHALSH